MKYRHKKSGRIYRYLATAADCTDGADDRLMAVYCPDDDEHTIYVRKLTEFYERFEVVKQ